MTNDIKAELFDEMLPILKGILEYTPCFCDTIYGNSNVCEYCKAVDLIERWEERK